MEAYDNALIGNMMAQPAFQKHFGEQLADGSYQVPPAWQSACSYASTAGAFIGILACGALQPKFGYKKLMIGSLFAMIAFIFIPFFAETLPIMMVGQLMCGIPWGFYNAIAQAYASEVAPLPLRGIFTMYNQSCWCTGQLITAGILYGFRNGTTKVSLQGRSFDWALSLTASGLTRSLSQFSGRGLSPYSPFSGSRPSLPGGWSGTASWRLPLDLSLDLKDVA
jgi:SP family general alpha glucoside:H+ symporter-like MFS transporter